MSARPSPPARFLVALVLLSVTSTGAAQIPADTTRLDDLVVTATRTEEPRRSVPATVTVVSGEELRARGVRFVADWLREVPGAMVVATGSFGGVTSLFLRGGESDYTRVLVDGVAVNLPGGAVDLANLGTENVERVEILRGPASVLYGSDAVSGVIQILTRRGSGPAAVTAEARVGSRATSDLRLGASGSDGSGIWSWSAAASRFGSAGTWDFNGAYTSWTGSGRLAVRPDAGTDVALSLRSGDHRSHFPTDFTGAQVDSNQFSTERGLTVGLEAGRVVSSRLSVRLTGSLAAIRTGFSDTADGPADSVGFGFASARSSRIARRVLDGRVMLEAARWLSLTAGLELAGESERQESETSSNFGSGRFDEAGGWDHSRTNRAVYGQASARPLPALSLDAGVRAEDNEVFGGFTSWRAGLVWLPGAAWRAHLSAGTAFRQPTFPEQFADTPFEVGDPGLVPERTGSWEVGLEVTPVASLRVGATWFSQQFSDLIQYQFAAPGEPTYANVAEARSRGLELAAGWTAARGVGGSIQWTWVDTEVLESGSPAPAFTPGLRLLRRPAHSAAARLHWLGGTGVRVGVELTWTGDREDMDYREFPAVRATLDEFTLVHLSADLPVLGDLGFTARIENLLDARYQPVVGFPGRPRTLLAGLRWGN